MFVRQGALLAQRLDAGRGAVTGEAFPVAEKVGVDSTPARGRFAVAGSGLLLYESGGGERWRITWMDRAGAVLQTVGEPFDGSLTLGLSPDEKQVVFRGVSGQNSDIWVQDLARGLATRFTFHPAIEVFPVWSPDGSRIVFSSTRLERGH